MGGGAPSCCPLTDRLGKWSVHGGTGCASGGPEEAVRVTPAWQRCLPAASWCSMLAPGPLPSSPGSSCAALQGPHTPAAAPWEMPLRGGGGGHVCGPAPHDQLLPPRPLTVSLWILTWKGKALGILSGHKAVVPQAAGDPVPLLALHWLTSFSVVPAQPVRKPSESRLGRVRLRRVLGCGWGSLTLPRGCRSGPERQLRSPRCAQKGLVSLRSKCFCPAVF